MLAVSPKTAERLRQSTGQPVLVARIVTALDDRLHELYSDWTTAGNIISEHRTQIVKEHELTANPQAFCEMLYPAQGGDPVQSIPAFTVAMADPGISIPISLGVGFSRGSIFQTFRLDFGSPLAYTIPKVTLRMKRTAKDAAISFQAVIVEIDEALRFGSPGAAGPLYAAAAFSNSISSDTLSASFADVTFTFSSPASITRGKRAAVLLLPSTTALIQSPGVLNDWVYVEGYTGKNLVPGEIAGSASFRPLYADFRRVPGLEMWCKISAGAYSYDGVTTSHRKMRYDFGAAPTGTGYVEANYRTPGDSRLQLRLWGSTVGNFTGEEVDLGKTDTHTLADHGHDGTITHVHDGDEVTGLYRFYAIDELFSSPSLAWSATVHRLGLAFIQREHRFSTAAVPALNCIPSLADVPSIPVKLDLKGYITQSQKWSIDIHDMAGEASLMGSLAHLKNATVELFLGFLDQPINSLAELTPYASGKVIDYSYERGLLKLDVQDRSKDLSIKLPKMVVTGSDVPAAIDYGLLGSTHLVSVIDDLYFVQTRTPRRYQDTDSFVSAKAALGTQWVTRRKITDDDQEEARELVRGVLEIIGFYVVFLETGRMKLVQYPRDGTSVDVWDETVLLDDVEQLPSFEDSIINQCVVKYNYDALERKYIGNFGHIDATSVADFAPGSALAFFDRVIKSPWLGGDDVNGSYLAQAVAQRVVAFAKEGVIRIKCRTTLAQFGVQVGELVTVKTPVFLEKGQRGVPLGKQFVVMGKKADVKDGTIDWELAEAHPANRPPVASFSATPQEGALPLTVALSATASDPDGDSIVSYEWDYDYDGRAFTVDATGTTANPTYSVANYETSKRKGGIVVALRVTDSRGAFTIQTRFVRFKRPPRARISNYQTDAGLPLDAELSAEDSVPGGNDLVVAEWDTEYNGVDFTPRAQGWRVRLSKHHKTNTVALRVTDLDGLTDTTTLAMTGKTARPNTPTGLKGAQHGDKAVLSWDANDDVDLYGYALHMQYEPSGAATATWAGSELVNEEILTNSVVMPTPRPYGSWSFLLRAIDSTGNQSVAEATALVTLRNPQDRLDISTRDEKALSWPGTRTQLYLESGANRLWIANTMPSPISGLPAETIGALAAATISSLGGPVYSEAEYVTPVVDLGAIYERARLNVAATFIRENETLTSYAVEFRVSDDNVTYTAWAAMVQSDLKFRYYQLRVRLMSADGLANLALDDLDIIVDMPVIRDSGTNLAVAGSGTTTITFNRTFNVAPAVTYKIRAMGSLPLYIDEVTAATKTSVGIRAKRVDNQTQVAAGVDWAAEGG